MPVVTGLYIEIDKSLKYAYVLLFLMFKMIFKFCSNL